MGKESPEKFEKPVEKEAEGAAFDALDLLKDQAKPEAGFKAALAEFAAMVRDPESLNKMQEKFDADFQKAVASDSPEPLKKMLKSNEKQIAAVTQYAGQLREQIEAKSALI